MEARLSASLEVSALLRRAEGAGGFGAILHKGDKQRGTILIGVLKRGLHFAWLERTLRTDGRYDWGVVGPTAGESQKSASFVAQRRRSDPDLWAIELDIPDAERFIAETSDKG